MYRRRRPNGQKPNVSNGPIKEAGQASRGRDIVVGLDGRAHVVVIGSVRPEGKREPAQTEGHWSSIDLWPVPATQRHLVVANEPLAGPRSIRFDRRNNLVTVLVADLSQ